MKPSQLLVQAMRLWVNYPTSGTFTRNAAGDALLDPCDRTAVAWDPTGAIYHVAGCHRIVYMESPPEVRKARMYLYEACADVGGSFTAVDRGLFNAQHFAQAIRLALAAND